MRELVKALMVLLFCSDRSHFSARCPRHIFGDLRGRIVRFLRLLLHSDRICLFRGFGASAGCAYVFSLSNFRKECVYLEIPRNAGASEHEMVVCEKEFLRFEMNERRREA